MKPDPNPITAPILSIMQPWASLIIFGAQKRGYPEELFHKSAENRSWSPSEQYLGQRIGIHAGKRWDTENPWQVEERKLDDPYVKTMVTFDRNAPEMQHRGVILGTVRLAAVIALKNGDVKTVATEEGFTDRHVTTVDIMWFKHYAEVFGWVFREPMPLPEPIKANGRLRVWHWKVPPHLVESIYYPYFKPEVIWRPGLLGMRNERTDREPIGAEKSNAFQQLKQAGRLRSIDPNQPHSERKGEEQ